MQLDVVRCGVPPGQLTFADTHQGAYVGGEAILVRAVQPHRRLRLRPCAVKQQQQPVVEHVGKTREAGIPMVHQPLPRIFGQVVRQGAVGAEQAEEAHLDTRLAVGRSRRNRVQCTGRKGQVRHLTQADWFVGRPARGSKARFVRKLALQPAHGVEEVVAPRLIRDALQGIGARYRIGRVPHRGLPTMMSPRVRDLTRVSVKPFMDTWRAKKRSSTLPKRKALEP